MYTEEIETYCNFSGKVVTLTMEATVCPSGTLITGKPIRCTLQEKCRGKPDCLLNAQRLTTRRRF